MGMDGDGMGMGQGGDGRGVGTGWDGDGMGMEWGWVGSGGGSTAPTAPTPRHCTYTYTCVQGGSAPLLLTRLADSTYCTAHPPHCRLQYHLLHGFDLHKSARSKQAGQIHTIWGNYLHYNILHAMEDIQWLNLLATECERVEQLNRPARSIAKTCSAQRVASVVKEIVERLQVEKIVNKEYGSGSCSDDGRHLDELYAKSMPSDKGRASFGKEYWKEDRNWPVLVKVWGCVGSELGMGQGGDGNGAGWGWG